MARFKALTIEILRLELERAFDGLDNPKEPKRVFSKPTADLPDASLYPKCVAFDETLARLVTSDGSAWV